MPGPACPARRLRWPGYAPAGLAALLRVPALGLASEGGNMADVVFVTVVVVFFAVSWAYVRACERL